MKYIFDFLLLVHGLIHLMGFVKGFQLAEISQLPQSISKTLGMLWLFIALVTVIISQILIIMYWQDAKFGTILNIIILISAIISLATFNFENSFKKDVSKALKTTNFTEEYRI